MTIESEIMNSSIILGGQKYLMNEIKAMQLIPDEGSDPLTFQIEVTFTNGKVENFPMTMANVAAFNAWISYMRTYVPASKAATPPFHKQT